MKKIFGIGLAVVLAGSIILTADNLWAGEPASLGSQEGSHPISTHKETVTTTSQSVIKDAAGQNDLGEAQKDGDKDSSTSTYSSTTTTADGKTTSTEGTVTKNTDGSLTQTGTITDPQGKTTTVESTTTDEDGSNMVETTYTDPDGKKVDVDKVVTPDDGTGDVADDNSTDTDDNDGIVTTKTTESSTVTTEHSAPNRYGVTWGWGQSQGVDADGKAVTRDIPEMKANDASRSFNENVSVHEATTGKK